ncbi:MAG: hypothetical protein ACW96U_00795 [Candidatus Heimdallarchaeaceae archaeon]|jgi:hypothetical protein
MNYHEEAEDYAKEFIKEHVDIIIDDAISNGEISTDPYHYSDSWIHESVTDNWFDLQESAEILDQLDEWEETDCGLWDGRSPKDAISAQAAYTYGNAVYSMVVNKLEKLDTFIDTINGEASPDSDEFFYDPLEEKIRQEITEYIS